MVNNHIEKIIEMTERKEETLLSTRDQELISLVNRVGLAARPFASNKGFSLINLPDFANIITEDVLAHQKRPQPRLACLAALTLLSLVADNTETSTGLKLNLFSIVISDTGSGKDAHQEYVNEVASTIGLGHHIFDKIGSEKDLTLNLLESDNKTLYINDEAHSFFTLIQDKSSPAYIREIESKLLAAYTGKIIKLNGIRIRELHNILKAEKESIAKRFKNNSDEVERCCNELEEKFEKLKCEGIRNPYLSLMATSTPREINGFINDKNLDSGLLARCIVIKADRRSPLRDSYKRDIDINVLDELIKINKNSKSAVEPTEDAIELLDKVKKYYDNDEILNHEIFGGIYCRMYEMVSKIASILAVGNQFVLTLPHVNWAHEFVYKSVADIIETYHANSVSSVSSDFDIYYSTMQRIVVLIGNNKSGITQGVLSQKLSQSAKSKLPLRNIIEKYSARTCQNPANIFAFFIKKIIENAESLGIQVKGKKISIINKDLLLNVNDIPEWFSLWLSKLKLKK